MITASSAMLKDKTTLSGVAIIIKSKPRYEKNSIRGITRYAPCVN